MEKRLFLFAEVVGLPAIQLYGMVETLLCLEISICICIAISPKALCINLSRRFACTSLYRLLFDEFANIKIPQMERLISVFRSREISAALVVQAQSQLKAIYDKHADTIVGNCDAMLFLGGKEKTTLEEMVKTLGKETIDTYNNSETKGNSPSFGKNYSKLGKDLMTMDELAVMDGGKCILQLRGVRPFLSDKFDITRHKNYKYLSDYNEKNAFNVQRYLSTRLRVRPDEEFELYDIELPEDGQSA